MNWKELLKRLKLESIKAKAPGFFEQSGGYNMGIKSYTDNTANGLNKCIEDFIKHLGGYANRVNTMGMVRIINGKARWTKGNSNKGAFDLRFVYAGRSADVEIKIGRDRMSEAQLQEMQNIIAAGGLTFIARNFPSFLQWFIENFPEAHSKLIGYGYNISQHLNYIK